MKTNGWIELGVVLACATVGCTLSDQSIGDDGTEAGESGTDAGDDDGLDDIGPDTGDDGNSGSETDAGDDGDEDPSTSGSDGLDDGGSDDDSGMCLLPPLSEKQIGNAQINANTHNKVVAGETEQIEFNGLVPGGIEPLEACMQWSIEPASAGSIDQDGLLTVAGGLEPGTTFVVTADVEDGRRILTVDLEIYVPIDAPVVGTWSEVGRLTCGDYIEVAAEPEPVNEVVFFDTGDFWVTWTPFEVYVDYWGSFDYDEATDTVTMTSEGGNYVPKDFDLEGTAAVDPDTGRLVLTDMWFGQPQFETVTVACGHVLE